MFILIYRCFGKGSLSFREEPASLPGKVPVRGEVPKKRGADLNKFFRFFLVFSGKKDMDFLIRAVFLSAALGAACSLAGCGRRDNPEPPGPAKSVTVGLVYPSPAFINNKS